MDTRFGNFSEGEIEIEIVRAALNRNKRLIALATLGAAAAALIFYAMVEPRYIAVARILYATQETPARDTEAVNGQIQLLTSRDLARKAVQALDLQGNPEFNRNSGLLAPLVWLGVLPDPSQRTAEDRALTHYFDHLSVTSPIGTRVLQVAFTSRDPDLSARGANRLADLYIDLQREGRRERARLAMQNLEPPLVALEAPADDAAPDARILSRALSPTQPVFPKKVLIALFAALAGLLVSIGAVAMRAMFFARSPLRRAPPPPREMDAPEEPPGHQAPPAHQEPQAPAVALVGEQLDSPLPARVNASRRLIERIAGTAGRGGAHVLIASAGESAPACASLTLARSLSREGRAILLQTDDQDLFLSEALEVAAGACDATHPGLSHLLSGEASFADAIFRDDATRLHIVQAGGPVDAHSSDLSLILDALHATYDFVLIAAGGNAAARSLAAESDLTLIFAEDRQTRAILRDDFAASGARPIMLAGLDRGGEIVEIAA
jgi:capsular polysaccharide biosynthesis protein